MNSVLLFCYSQNCLSYRRSQFLLKHCCWYFGWDSVESTDHFGRSDILIILNFLLHECHIYLYLGLLWFQPYFAAFRIYIVYLLLELHPCFGSYYKLYFSKISISQCSLLVYRKTIDFSTMIRVSLSIRNFLMDVISILKYWPLKLVVL
jgi:hypothetical protein